MQPKHVCVCMLFGPKWVFCSSNKQKEKTNSPSQKNHCENSPRKTAATTTKETKSMVIKIVLHEHERIILFTFSLNLNGKTNDFILNFVQWKSQRKTKTAFVRRSKKKKWHDFFVQFKYAEFFLSLSLSQLNSQSAYNIGKFYCWIKYIYTVHVGWPFRLVSDCVCVCFFFHLHSVFRFEIYISLVCTCGCMLFFFIWLYFTSRRKDGNKMVRRFTIMKFTIIIMMIVVRPHAEHSQRWRIYQNTVCHS